MIAHQPPSPNGRLRVLFGLLWPGLGGHSRTAISLADALRQRGTIADFLVDASTADTGLIRDAGFRVFDADYLNGDFFQRRFTHRLNGLVRAERYDAIHWFETFHGVYEAARVAAATDCAFVWTVTSGGPPPDYHGLNRAVVYTREVADHARQKDARIAIYLQPARVSFDDFTDTFIAESREEVRRRLGVDHDTLLVARVARCAQVYLPSIRHGLELSEAFNRRGRRAMFLHAGYVQASAVAREIRAAVEAANARARRIVAHTETEDVAYGAKYLAAADICISSGRSAIEAVALARPTLINWGHRYLGIVTIDNIRGMAESNFQGRLAAPTASSDRTVEHMLEDVGGHLHDRETSTRSLADCSAYVREHYSAERAADEYTRLYLDRTVTCDGPFKHYFHPRRFAREIRRALPRRIRHHPSMNLLRRLRGERQTW
jgi:hypothetical protein